MEMLLCKTDGDSEDLGSVINGGGGGAFGGDTIQSTSTVFQLFISKTILRTVFYRQAPH